jgi:hypothetical protein
VGGALIAGAGVLTGVLSATNAHLHGAWFLAALALGALGVVFLVEAAARQREAHPAPFYIAGGAMLTAALAVGIASGQHRKPTPPINPLRAAFTQTPPADFEVAFRYDIGTPAQSVGWDVLHARGAVDVLDSEFRFTLANRSATPLSISDLHAQVLGPVSAPTNTEASVYVQGDVPVESFLVRLYDAAPGSSARFYRTNHLGDPQRTPFFQTHSISLKPGEIYQGAVSVKTFLTGAVRYRFVLSGQTPTASFLTVIPGVFVISGRTHDWSSYAHHYWNLSDCQARHYWVKVRTKAQWLTDPYLGGCANTKAGQAGS